jgi:putative chitinase
MTSEQFLQITPRAPKIWIDSLITEMSNQDINTPLRESAFISQIAHESSELTHLEENLNYSAERLMIIFPKKFLTIEFAQQYNRQPEKIANYIYSNRMNNGDESSGDGWKYRGRGAIQITGKYNYQKYATLSGKPLIDQPELVLDPLIGSQVACLFWTQNGLNFLADVEDMETITRRINGGLIGFPERMKYYEKAKEVLGVT